MNREQRGGIESKREQEEATWSIGEDGSKAEQGGNTGSEKSKDHRGSGEGEQGRAKGAKRMQGPVIGDNWDKKETEESNGEKEETLEGAMGSRAQVRARGT